MTGIIPEGVEGEVPDENLMEGKTADQGGPEEENRNEEGVEGEIPGDGGDGDKGGELPNDFDEELPNDFDRRPEPPNLWWLRSK